MESVYSIKNFVFIVIFSVIVSNALLSDDLKYGGLLTFEEVAKYEKYTMVPGVYLKFNSDPSYDLSNLKILSLTINDKKIEARGIYVFIDHILIELKPSFKFSINDKFKLKIQFDLKKIVRVSTRITGLEINVFRGKEIENDKSYIFLCDKFNKENSKEINKNFTSDDLKGIDFKYETSAIGANFKLTVSGETDRLLEIDLTDGLLLNNKKHELNLSYNKEINNLTYSATTGDSKALVITLGVLSKEAKVVTKEIEGEISKIEKKSELNEPFVSNFIMKNNEQNKITLLMVK